MPQWRDVGSLSVRLCPCVLLRAFLPECFCTYTRFSISQLKHVCIRTEQLRASMATNTELEQKNAELHKMLKLTEGSHQMGQVQAPAIATSVQDSLVSNGAVPS